MLYIIRACNSNLSVHSRCDEKIAVPIGTKFSPTVDLVKDPFHAFHEALSVLFFSTWQFLPAYPGVGTVAFNPPVNSSGRKPEAPFIVSIALIPASDGLLCPSRLSFCISPLARKLDPLPLLLLSSLSRPSPSLSQ